MIKTLIIAGGIAAMALGASSAFAGECTEDQEAAAGMLAAGVGKSTVSKVVAVTGKQMVNISSCDFRGGNYSVDFKYNFLAADGLYWVELNAKFDGTGGNATTKVSKTSPNMAAAEAKAGVKLASN